MQLRLRVARLWPGLFPEPMHPQASKVGLGSFAHIIWLREEMLSWWACNIITFVATTNEAQAT